MHSLKGSIFYKIYNKLVILQTLPDACLQSIYMLVTCKINNSSQFQQCAVSRQFTVQYHWRTDLNMYNTHTEARFLGRLISKVMSFFDSQTALFELETGTGSSEVWALKGLAKKFGKNGDEPKKCGNVVLPHQGKRNGGCCRVLCLILI